MSQLVSFTLVIICCFLELGSFVSSYPCIASDICKQGNFKATQAESIYKRNIANASTKELFLNITLNKVMNQTVRATISKKTVQNYEQPTVREEATSWSFHREEHKKLIPSNLIVAAYTGNTDVKLNSSSIRCQPKELLIDLIVLKFNNCTESEGKEKWMVTTEEISIGFICRKVLAR